MNVSIRSVNDSVSKKIYLDLLESLIKTPKKFMNEYKTLAVTLSNMGVMVKI